MNTGLKKTIRYLGVFLFTVFLLWVALNNIEVKNGQTKMQFIKGTWSSVNKFYLIISAFVALLSHYFRSERWKLLLTPIKYPLKSSHSFMSVMVGYFVNLAIPRGGELSRCYNLYKLNRTPVNISFGTVVSERVIDLFFLLSLISSVLLIQLDVFDSFFKSLQLDSSNNEDRKMTIIYVISGFTFFTVLIIAILYRTKKLQLLRIIIKIKSILVGIKSGLLSILKLEKRSLFILYSLLIWISYYLMNYFVMQAFPATSELDLLAALTIFVIGGIALAVPLPGGAGSYHILVSAGLTFIYGVSNDQAVAFSVIVHGWQTLVIIVVGAGSLITSQINYKTQK